MLQDGDGSKLPYAESRISNELDKSKMWEPTEINEPVQLRNLMLPDSLLPVSANFVNFVIIALCLWAHPINPCAVTSIFTKCT